MSLAKKVSTVFFPTANLNIDIKVSKTPDQILVDTDVTLTCIVNLPAAEIDFYIIWTLPGDRTQQVNFDGVEDGKYELMLTSVKPETESGDYTCTASTTLQTGETVMYSAIQNIDVKGKLIVVLSFILRMKCSSVL